MEMEVIPPGTLTDAQDAYDILLRARDMADFVPAPARAQMGVHGDRAGVDRLDAHAFDPPRPQVRGIFRIAPGPSPFACHRRRGGRSLPPMSPILLAVAPIFGLILLGFVLNRITFPAQGFWPASERLTYYALFPAPVGGRAVGPLL